MTSGPPVLAAMTYNTCSPPPSPPPKLTGPGLPSWLSRWIPWIRNGTFALTDQALISASNFLMSVLLARWLGSTDYGVYALAFAVYLFLLGCFQALVIEPMCVFGAAEYSDRFQLYMGVLLRLQAILSIAIFSLFGLALIVCQVVVRFRSAVSVLFGLAVGCPLLLTFFLLRTATYVTGRPATAARAAALYCVAVLVPLGVIQIRGHMSAGAPFLIMGGASAVASVWLLRILKPAWSGAEFGPLHVAKESWDFGRWELARVGSDWICENTSYLIAGGVLGIAQVGTLKALTTLFLPLNQTLNALRRIFLPYLSRKFRQTGHGSTARESIRYVALLYAAGAAFYGLVLSVGAHWLVPLLYGKRFGSIVGLVPWYASLLVFVAPVYALDMGLRAVRLPKAIFISSGLVALWQVAIAWPAAHMFGLLGLILSNFVSAFIFLGTMMWNLRKATFSSAPAETADSSVPAETADAVISSTILE